MSTRYDKCYTALRASMRGMDVSEEVLNSMDSTYRTIKKQRHLNADQQIKKLHEVSQEMRKRVYEDQVTKVKAEAKMQEIIEWVDEFPTIREKIEALHNFIEQDAWYGATTRQSVAKTVNGLERFYLQGKLKPVFDALATKGLRIREKTLTMDFHREMRGVDTGNKLAQELVSQVREVTDMFLGRLQEAGVYVGRIDNWGPQSHSVSRISSDSDTWFRFMRENLDPEFHPDAESSAQVIYSSIITRESSTPTMKSISQSRKVHFKSPEAEVEYFLRYGEGSFVEVLSNNIQGLIRDAVVAEHLGPRPTHVVQTAVKKLAKEVELDRGLTRAQKNAATRKLQTADRVTQSLVGELYHPANQNLANWSSAVRNGMVAQFLGLVPLAMVSQDSFISLLAARFHAGGFGRGITDQMKALIDVIGDKHARAYAENLGVWNHAIHMASMNRYYTQLGQHTEGLTMHTGGRQYTAYGASESAKNVSQFAATAVTRISGAQMIERALRSATTLMQSRALAKWSQVNYSDLPANYRRVLSNSGIDQGKWGTLQRSIKQDPMTKAVDFESLTPEIREMVAVFLAREADLSVVYPSHYSRSTLIFGGRAGTMSGEVSSAFTQFMSWPLEMFRGAMMREYSMGAGGFMGFGAAMLAGGAFTTQLYALAKGEPMHNWDNPDFWIRSIGRSGLLSPVGEMAMQAAFMKHVDIPAGPVMSVPARALQTMTDTARREIDSHQQRNLGPIVRTLRDITIPNLWQLEATITNRAMDAVMWQIDPKYMINRERRFARERQ